MTPYQAPTKEEKDAMSAEDAADALERERAAGWNGEPSIGWVLEQRAADEALDSAEHAELPMREQLEAEKRAESGLGLTTTTLLGETLDEQLERERATDRGVELTPTGKVLDRLWGQYRARGAPRRRRSAPRAGRRSRASARWRAG